MNGRYEWLSRDPGFRALVGIAQRRRCAAQQIVIAEGGQASKLYVLVSGLATVRAAGPQGIEMLLAYLYPGDFFGEMCLFPRQDARSAMIRAATECSLLEIPYEPFIELTRKHPSLWLELAGQLAERLRTTNHRFATMPVLHAAERVWQVVAEMARNVKGEETPEVRIVRVKRADLGRLAGCSREVAGIALQDLATMQRLSLRGHAIVVPLSAL